MPLSLKDISRSVLWNLLLTIGAIVYSTGIKGIIVHHSFIPGGIFGGALLVANISDQFSPSAWFFMMNLPLFLIGWFFVGKRFFWYSLYGMVVITMASQAITVDFHITEQVYAAIAGGLICGAGSGIMF